METPHGNHEIKELKELVEKLKKENQILERRVNYWKIEANCDHERWIRTLEHLDHIRSLK